MIEESTPAVLYGSKFMQEISCVMGEDGCGVILVLRFLEVER